MWATGLSGTASGLASAAGFAAVAVAGAGTVAAGLASDAGFAGVWALAVMVHAASNIVRIESFMALSDSGWFPRKCNRGSGNFARRYYPSQQGSSGRQVLQHDGFVAGVGALAHGAHAVEGGNAERRGE